MYSLSVLFLRHQEDERRHTGPLYDVPLLSLFLSGALNDRSVATPQGITCSDAPQDGSSAIGSDTRSSEIKGSKNKAGKGVVKRGCTDEELETARGEKGYLTLIEK